MSTRPSAASATPLFAPQGEGETMDLAAIRQDEALGATRRLARLASSLAYGDLDAPTRHAAGLFAFVQGGSDVKKAASGSRGARGTACGAPGRARRCGPARRAGMPRRFFPRLRRPQRRRGRGRSASRKRDTIKCMACFESGVDSASFRRLGARRLMPARWVFMDQALSRRGPERTMK